METRNRLTAHVRPDPRAMWLMFCAFQLLIFFVPTHLPARSQREVEKLASSCRKNDSKACEKLKKIASSDKNEYVRRSAVEEVSDESFLVEVALTSDDATAWLAQKRVNDQALLTRLALDAKSSQVRRAAAARIVDGQSLSKVVASTNDPAVRALAQESLDWNAAERTGTIGAYEQFRQTYPRTDRLRVDSSTVEVGNFRMIANSNSGAAGPNGEIIATNFQTVIICELINDGVATGQRITLDEAEKRGFITRDPETGKATAIYKLIMRKLYKHSNGAELPAWTLVGDMEVIKVKTG